MSVSSGVIEGYLPGPKDKKPGKFSSLQQFCNGGEHVLQNRAVLSLAFCCVTLGSLPNLSQPPFPHLKRRVNGTAVTARRSAPRSRNAMLATM